MSNGGDRMMEKVLQDAIRANQSPASDGVCSTHEGIRSGVYALCLCEQERQSKPAPQPAVKTFKVGKMEFKGFDGADIVKILIGLAVLFAIAGDKLERFVADESRPEPAMIATK